MARTTLSQAIGLPEQNHEPLRALAEAAYMLTQLGDLANARQVVDAILIIAPKDPGSHFLLAQLLMAGGEFRKAEDAGRQATRLAGDDATAMAAAYNIRADAAVGQGKLDDAVAAWKNSLAVDPQGPASVVAAQRLRRHEAIRRAFDLPPSEG